MLTSHNALSAHFRRCPVQYSRELSSNTRMIGRCNLVSWTVDLQDTRSLSDGSIGSLDRNDKQPGSPV
jgi:hypothetical protein